MTVHEIYAAELELFGNDPMIAIPSPILDKRHRELLSIIWTIENIIKRAKWKGAMP